MAELGPILLKPTRLPWRQLGARNEGRDRDFWWRRRHAQGRGLTLYPLCEPSRQRSERE
jgi:hypothetical protein